MGYVTNAGWLDGIAMEGMRTCLAEEFASVHVFHLRGNQRTQGETSRREGGKIFGSGSRAPIAITVFVKSPEAKEQGRIVFHDIGDYLDRKQKLDTIVTRFGSVRGIDEAGQWGARITPDEYGDWLDQRDTSFDAYPKIGDEERSTTRCDVSRLLLWRCENQSGCVVHQPIPQSQLTGEHQSRPSPSTSPNWSDGRR